MLRAERKGIQSGPSVKVSSGDDWGCDLGLSLGRCPVRVAKGASGLIHTPSFQLRQCAAEVNNVTVSKESRRWEIGEGGINSVDRVQITARLGPDKFGIKAGWASEGLRDSLPSLALGWSHTVWLPLMRPQREGGRNKELREHHFPGTLDTLTFCPITGVTRRPR